MATIDTRDTGTDGRRQQAIERLKKRSEFWTHLTAYLLVNAMIVVVWLAISPGRLFWPLFPMAGWGIGVFYHGMEAFRRPYSEERIRREIDRLA